MDRPLFDDESLPAWLKNAGITYAGRKRATGPAPSVPAASSAADMSWMADSAAPAMATGDTPPWMHDLGAAAAEAETPPWMEERSDGEAAVEVPGWMHSLDEGMVATTASSSASAPWMQAEPPSKAPAASRAGDDVMPWMQAQDSEPQAQSTNRPAWGGTSALPWRQGVSASEDAPASADAADMSLPWESAASTENAPSNQANDFDFGNTDNSPFGEPEPPKAADPEPPAKPRGLADRLRATGTQTAVPSSDLNWLNDEPAAEPAPQAQARASDDFNWLNAGLGDAEAEAPQGEAAPADAAADDLNWLNDVAPAETPAEPAASSEDEFGWLNAPSEEAQTPEPAQAEAEPASDLDWLNAAPVEDNQPPEPEPTPEPPAEAKPLKSLKSLKSLRETGPQPQQPAAEEPPAEAPRPAIKRLPKASDQQSAQPAMPAMSMPPAEPAPDLSNMTYDEWDRMQQQKEEQAKAAADPNLINEVPDWFKSAASTPTSTVDDADAPDWFKSMSAPSGQPAPAAPADDVPDWFKGSAGAPGADNLDFNALFGASSAPEPVQSPPLPPTLPPAMQAPPAPKPPAAPPTPPPAPAMPEPAHEAPQAESAIDFSDMLDFVSEEPHEPAEEPAAEAGDMPDWMQGMAPAASTPLAEPEDDLEAEAGDMPDWMRNMAPAEPAPAAEPAPQDDMDWLSNIDEHSASAPAETPELNFDEGQDWLSGVTPESAAAQAPAPSVDLDLSKPVNIDELLNLTPVSNSGPLSSTASLEKLDDLDEFNLDEVLGPAPEMPAEEPSAEFDDFEVSPITTPGGDLPKTGSLRRIGEPAQPEPPKQSDKLEQLPDWIADLKPSDAPVPLRIGDQEVRLKEVPVGQLDDQLRQLRERSKAMKNRAAAGEAPASGALSGIAGALDVAQTAVTPTAAAMSSSTPVVTDVQAKRVKLIQQILELEEEAVKERGEEEAAVDPKVAARARAAVRHPFPKVDRIVITILLALAVIGPFLSGALTNIMPVPDKPTTQASHDAFVNKITTIQAGQPVLVAFEYGPTAAGELDDLARAILGQILKEGAHPIVVSTNPAGALHAEALLESIANDKTLLASMGRTPDQSMQSLIDYVVLRYLPGGAAGVRSIANALLTKDTFQEQIIFGTDITGRPTGKIDLAALQNNPAIVFAESPEDVRNWAEQYNSSLYSVSATQQLSLMLVSSASASAVAETYANTAAVAAGTTGTPRITGPLVGLRDAMTYNGKTSDPAMIQRWASVGLAALLAGLVIFVGLLINLVRVLQRRSG